MKKQTYNESSVYIQKECKKDFDVDNEDKIKTFDSFNIFSQIKNDYNLAFDFNESIKNIKNGNKINNNFVILKLKDLKNFLENFDLLNKNSYELECIKTYNHNQVIEDNINFYEPISFIVYLNFHNKYLYSKHQIILKFRKNLTFYHEFMNNIMEYIFKLEKNHLFVKKSSDLLYSEKEILFFNFLKKKDISTFSSCELFVKIIKGLISFDRFKNFDYVLPLLNISYNYFSKINKSVNLDRIIIWNQFKELYYQLIIKEKDSMAKFNRFLLQFKGGNSIVSEKKQESNFKLDTEFAIKKIPRQKPDNIDEKSLIFKLFGYNSQDSFSFIFSAIFLTNILIFF